MDKGAAERNIDLETDLYIYTTRGISLKQGWLQVSGGKKGLYKQ